MHVFLNFYIQPFFCWVSSALPGFLCCARLAAAQIKSTSFLYFYIVYVETFWHFWTVCILKLDFIKFTFLLFLHFNVHTLLCWVSSGGKFLHCTLLCWVSAQQIESTSLLYFLYLVLYSACTLLCSPANREHFPSHRPLPSSKAAPRLSAAQRSNQGFGPNRLNSEMYYSTQGIGTKRLYSQKEII